MASLKSNIRSFRYSDEIAAILEKQTGDSFNAKFESLVLRCFWELPQQEKKLAFVYKEIEMARAQLMEVQVASRKLIQMQQQLESAMRLMGSVEQAAKDIEATVLLSAKKKEAM